LLLPSATLASTGLIDATSKYAWGSSMGWVNFNPMNGNVAVSDSFLSGSAWSENYGWVNLSPNASGVKNDGTGILSGYAWGENTGYIDFSGVRINAQGVFTGTATGDIVGSLTFDCTNCRVSTTWRPSAATSATTAASPSVSVSGGYVPPDFRVDGGASSTQSPAVTLSFSTPPSVSLLSLRNESVAGNSTATSSFQSVLAWNLCTGLASCPPGAYSVTVRFLDAQGNTLSSVSHSIAYLPIASSSPSTTTASNLASSTASSTVLAAAASASTSASTSSTDLAQQIAGLQAQLQVLLRQAAASNTPAAMSISSFHFTRDLTLGMTGADVKQLQTYLVAQHSGPAARALKAHGLTKNFGALTRSALVEFQKKVGIKPASGYCGPKTRAYVNGHAR
jgi:hypothetical protein